MARGDLRLARLFYQIEADTSGLKRELGSAEASLGRLTAFVTKNPVAAMGALAAAAAAAGLKAASMAAQFDNAVRRIAAVVPGATSQLARLREEANRLASSRGLTSEQVLGGLGAVAREGVTDLDALVARFEILQTVADATGSEVGGLATGFDQILDVLGLTDDSLAQVAARLTQVSQGRFPIEDLFAAFQAAAPAIRANGLSFDEAANALANYVANGLNAKQAGGQLKDTLEKLGREGLAGLPNLIGDVSTALDGLTERAAVVEQGVDRMSTALRERFAERVREIGQAINAHILDPLRAGLVLATDLNVPGGLGGRIGAFAAGLAGRRPALGGASPAGTGEDRGGPVLLPDLTVTAPGPEQLRALAQAQEAARDFSADLAKSTATATKTLVDDLLLALGDFESRFRATAQNLTADARAQAETRLAELRAQVEAIRKAEAAPTLIPVAQIDAALQVRRETGDMADDAERAARAAEEQSRAYEATQRALEQARQQVRLEADEIVRATRAALQLAEAFGIMDDNLADALNGIAQVGAELKVVAANGLSLGSATTIAGGFASIVGGLFGESADAKRDREIREQNTRAIRELTKSLSDQVAGRTVTSAAAGVEALLGAGRSGIGRGRFDGQLDLDAVARALAPLGLSLRDLKDLLKEINPDLKLNTSSTDDFLESLAQMRKALAEVDFRAFADSFAGELAFLQARFDLLDLTNPLDQLAALQALAAEQSPLLQDLLGGLDLSTAGGRQAAEQALADLLGRLKDGSLTAADLGGLSSQELLDLIRQIEGLIDTVNSDQGTSTGPRQETFGVTRGLTEVTGSRLAGILVSQDTHLVEIRDLLAAFVPVAAPGLPPGVGVGPGPVVFEVNVYGTPDAGTAQAIGATVGAAAVDSYRTQGARARSRALALGDTVVT